jgi:hypothetical protein
LYSSGKSRDLILSGTTFENMLLKYARKQRASIYHSATIDDLPFEVLREAFLYLKPEDLVSPSRVNRSWRPAAQDVQRARLQIDFNTRKRLGTSFMCGSQLSRIVFGYEAFSIKHLVFDVRLVDQEYIPILSRLFSTTLCTLEVSFTRDDESESCYEILDQFFSQCPGIRNLKLNFFDFGVDPASISQTIKDGFCRLSQLSLQWGRGDLSMFVELVQIPELRSFINRYWDGDSDIVSAIAIVYPTIKRLRLEDSYNSSATLLKFAECCREIEELSYCDCSGSLERRDIEAIASLPLLKSLNIDCEIADDAFFTLSRCQRLRHLILETDSFDLNVILHSIGRNLVSLEYNTFTPFLEAIDAIVEHCPNLQMLNLGYDEFGVEKKDAADLLKGGLKNLSKLIFKRGSKKMVRLKMNGKSVRLGTDWEGYR